MKNTPPHSFISRRGTLKLAAASALAAGGYALYEFTPWLNSETQANQMRSPLALDQDSAMLAQLRELVRFATLAASGHNTQPWKFALTAGSKADPHEGAIEIHPDDSRRLPVVDPQDRELWISLGCALENLLIAARAAGYATDVTYPDTAEHIHVRLMPDAPQRSSLFDAIPLRQNTRSEYDGQALASTALDDLQGLPLEPGVALWFATNPAQQATVLDYVNQGNLRQYADKAFVDELMHWLRFNTREATASLDGLFARCSGNPEVPRWLGQLFLSNTKPAQQADADAKKLRSSPGAVVVTSEADSKASWVRTGQVYERLALKMTSLNIKSAFLNQPIEVQELRSQFQSTLGLGKSRPQLLVRFGYADPLPRSLRRPIEHVII